MTFFQILSILFYNKILSTLLQVDVSQEALQARVDAAANEVRAFARGYASAVEAHCLSLLRRLEELRVQRRYGTNTGLIEQAKEYPEHGFGK